MHTPGKSRRHAIRGGQTGQRVTPFRVSPVMTASIPLLILLSRTRLHALWKNARFRCKIPVFCVGCNTPQGPLSGHPCRTNRPARRSFSSQPRYDRFDTAAYVLLPRLRRTAYYSRRGAACQMQIRTAFCRAAALRLRAPPGPVKTAAVSGSAGGQRACPRGGGG